MVDYFVVGPLNSKPTIIEQTVYQRLNLFQQWQRDVRIVSLEYSRNWRSAMRKAGIESSLVLNIFDQIQNGAMLPIAPLTLATYSPLQHLKQLVHHDYVDCFDGQQRVARAKIDGDIIATVDYFDVSGELIQRDTFDERGFIGMRRWYVNGELHTRTLLMPTGEPAVTWEKQANDWRITLSSTGEVFHTQRELLVVLLTRRLSHAGLLVCDRREYDSIVATVKTAQHRIYRLYNSPLKIRPQSGDIILTRQGSRGIQEVELDEYASAEVQNAGWLALLKQLDVSLH